MLVSTAHASAEIKQIHAEPTSWKLENYFGDAIVVFFSGSTCTNGRLTFPSSATVGDKNRFYSTVLTSRAAKTKMFVRYYDTTTCDIVSFGVAG